ncbi:MAG: hypothetical protein WCI62_04665, partial [Erysipelotrichaceae bacterium]
FETEFAGLRAICMNVGGANATYFNSIWDEEKYDMMIAFCFTGLHWKYTMFTTKEIDLSIIAKDHGGGGHRQAAGFKSLTNLLTI